MGGPAGDDFKDAGVLKFAKGLDEVAMIAIAEEVAAVIESVMVEAGEGLKGGVVLGAVQFLRGEFDLFFETVDVAVLKKWISEHGAEGRGHGHGQTEVDAVTDEALHHIKEGEIGFGNGLVEPVLFKKLGVFGVANEGEVGVKDWGYISEGHRLKWGGVGSRGKCRGVGWSQVWGRFRCGDGVFPSFQKSQSGGVE